jgi:hypothetical protein
MQISTHWLFSIACAIESKLDPCISNQCINQQLKKHSKSTELKEYNDLIIYLLYSNTFDVFKDKKIKRKKNNFFFFRRVSSAKALTDPNFVAD